MHVEHALITGATSGIGLALVHLLMQKRIPLIASGRSRERLASLGCETMQCELQEPGPLLEVVRKRAPDLLINNAGFGLYGNAADADPATLSGMIDVNCKAVVALTLEGIRALRREQKRGVILNVSSIADRHSGPGMAVYAATKAFVTQFSKAVDFEQRGSGIRVLVASPGMVATEFAERAGGHNPQMSSRLTSERAAQEIWHQIERGKGHHTFDWRARFSSWLGRHILPEKTLHKLIYQNIQSRL